ncbi:MAG: ABC-2 family transporter protein, partial [Planctomycetes bacterium]|nr:ABC-2 family transporter protein [Planctomycetota bacterium]
MTNHPSYLRVFRTFARNSLIRDMTFRTNFVLQCISSISWTLMNLGFYLLIFKFVDQIGPNTGWRRDEFFVFLATTWFVNSLVQTFFMPNAEEFSELIRTGGLDFVLLKPIDTQFIVSLRRVAWSQLINFFFGLLLLTYALSHLDYRPGLVAVLLYPMYVVCGVLIM